MDPLTALRLAIMEGRASSVRVDGSDLVIDDSRYPALCETAFKVSNAARTYKLLALWLQYVMREHAFTEYMKACTEHKLPISEMVMITDKKDVVDYLTGVSAALGRIETSRLTAGAAAAGGAASAATAAADRAAAEGAEEVITWEMALRREIPYRTLDSVLDVPGKNLMAAVFPMLREQSVLMGASESAPIVLDAKPATPEPTLAGTKRGRPTSAGAAAAPNMDGFAGTPYIIVPASTTSLINMYNAEAFFRDGRFVPPLDARAAATGPKPDRITIVRRDTYGNEARFHVTDNVNLFRNRGDWMKVVAVFAQGPEWQFKGWRWGRTPDRPEITPAEIFDRCLGFAIVYEGDTPHPNIQKWSVTPLIVSKSRRYLDAGLAAKFWGMVDTQIYIKQSYLAPKGGNAAGAAAADGGMRQVA